MPENFENKENSEEVFEEKEIPSEKFLEILSSKNFLKALTISGQETLESGYETVFRVNVLDNGDTYIVDVTRGGTDRIDPGTVEVLATIDGYKNVSEKSAALLGFHFHPEVKGEEIIQPSSIDLTGLKYFAFIGIGQIGETGIDILLVQKKRGISNSEIKENSEEYKKEASERGFISKQEESQEILDNNGFEGIVISYKKRGEEYKLTQKSRKRILGIGKIKLNMEEGC